MVKKILLTALIAFALFNVVCFMHAYKFTHFTSEEVTRTDDPKQLSISKKIITLLTGIDNPRPKNKTIPNTTYESISIDSDVKLGCWKIPVVDSKGTVILFHGYAGEKSSLIERSYYFNELGYSTLLVDFKGSGNSEGNSTSIGYHESDEVKSCYDYVRASGEQNIVLFGTSMGSVAILKCLSEYKINPAAVVLECPFGSLYTTTCARFRNMHVPTFPAAGILLFWGGVQNQFWPFAHNPSAYAKEIKCPTILLYGSHDDRVSLDEITEINDNLKGEKMLKIYSDRGHNDLFGIEMKRDVQRFIETSIR